MGRRKQHFDVRVYDASGELKEVVKGSNRLPKQYLSSSRVSYKPITPDELAEMQTQRRAGCFKNIERDSKTSLLHERGARLKYVPHPDHKGK